MFVPTVDFNDGVECHKLNRFATLNGSPKTEQPVSGWISIRTARHLFEVRQLKGCFVL
jgi:hypothetical protein